MSTLNRREMLQLGAVCGLGAMIDESGFPRQAIAADSPPTATAAGESPIKTRMFWTWDNSTEWALNRPGAQTIGACNQYGRTKEAFLEDYTALLRWCGCHNIDAVVVWGLLRDCHGGMEAAKRLCDVAAKEKVRLLCGVGLNAYGGVYYEGNSPYSLERHLQAHPELYALYADGDKMIIDVYGNKVSFNNSGMPGPRGHYHACPSRRENQDFIAESLTWLFKNLELGGVQIETGDTGVCLCKQCRDRRKHPVSTFSWEDMALMYPLATAAIRSVAPDAWIVCETYSHPQPCAEPNNEAPGFGGGKPAWADAALAEFPRGRGIFVQWVCDQFVRGGPTGPAWTTEGRVSSTAHHNVMRAHFGTYWDWGWFRGELAIEWIAKMVQQSMTAGFDGISLFGEVSPFYAGAELNYLALADFGSAGNPKADLDAFEQRVASPLLGGVDNVRDFVRFARLLDVRLRDDRKKIPAALTSIYGRLASLSPDAARRWCWLANQLASFAPS